LKNFYGYFFLFSNRTSFKKKIPSFLLTFFFLATDYCASEIKGGKLGEKPFFEASKTPKAFLFESLFGEASIPITENGINRGV